MSYKDHFIVQVKSKYEEKTRRYLRRQEARTIIDDYIMTLITELEDEIYANSDFDGDESELSIGYGEENSIYIRAYNTELIFRFVIDQIIIKKRVLDSEEGDGTEILDVCADNGFHMTSRKFKEDVSNALLDKYLELTFGK